MYLPTDAEVQEWFEINIGKKCSASSAIYKFRLWLKDLNAGKESDTYDDQNPDCIKNTEDGI